MQQLSPHGTLKTVMVQIFLLHGGADDITSASEMLRMGVAEEQGPDGAASLLCERDAVRGEELR
ncbi:MAG TPA: hypothetical protein VIM60_10000 [Edaphobacter sp.]